MTVETLTDKATGLGNGVATVFSYSPIVIYKTTDIVVTHFSTANVETILVEGVGATNYSVAPASGAYPSPTGVTGSITYPADAVTPMATGEKVVIKRVLPLEQTNDLENQGGYFPDIQETSLDKLVMIALQQQEQLDRAIQVPISEDTIGDFPLLADRKGKYLIFDALTGDPDVIDGQSASGTSVLSLGSTTPRLLANRWADITNVMDFGATGDGVTDDRAAIIAAMDSVDVGGGTVFFPAGVYRVATTITRTRQQHMVGEYKTTFGETIGADLYGSTLLFDANATLDFNPGAAGVEHFGPKIENMNFVGPSADTVTTLVRIRKMNRWTVSHCGFREAGIGLDVDNGTVDASWGYIEQCVGKNCDKIVRAKVDTSGDGSSFTVVGGDYEARAAGIAFDLETGTGSHKFIGVKIDNEIGIKAFGQALCVTGCILEKCDPAIHIGTTDQATWPASGKFACVTGSHFTGVNSGDVAILIDALGDSNVFVGNTISNYATDYTDNGTNNVILSHDQFKSTRLAFPFDFAAAPEFINGALLVSGAAAPIYIGIKHDSGKEWRIRSESNGRMLFKNETDAATYFELEPAGGFRVNEQGSAPAGVVNVGILYTIDDGGGLTELRCRFGSGDIRLARQDGPGVATFGDAAATLNDDASRTNIWNTALTADRAVTLGTTGVFQGEVLRILRNSAATGAFNLNVGTGPLKALAAADDWCDVTFNGTAWVLTATGTL